METYSETNRLLCPQFDLNKKQIDIVGSAIEIRNCTFRSTFQFVDPELSINEATTEILSPPTDKNNQRFSYSVFMPSDRPKSKEVILLFHGLNERSWDKYLSWAKYLVEHTGQAVLLFPMAHHMNRSPENWSNPSFLMSYMRHNEVFGSDKSNFANAALSERLIKNPKQFFVSGAQTIQDIVGLIDHVKSGSHPVFEKNTTFNLFGYSIGAFLAQILLIANPKSYFKNSKLLLFCGGPTFDQMNGISKYIMNKDAFESLRKLFLTHNNTDIKKRLYVKSMLNVKKHYEAFLTMLRVDKTPRRRDRRLRKFSKQIYAICLQKDLVMPAVSILNTLKGRRGDIPIQVDLMDFNYQYSHENPFPIFKDGKQKMVDRGFEAIFSKAARFYNA